MLNQEKAKKEFRGEDIFFAYDVDSNLGGDEWDVIAEWCISNISTGDVFIEIGAQLGYMSVMVCKFSDPSLAILVEPDSRTIPLLEENLRMNAKCPYKILQTLVLDKPGKEEFYLDLDNPAVNSIYKRELHNTEKVIVPVTTIDQIVEDFKITKPIVMKIDAEFSEHLIWRGMQKSIPLIKAVCMEFHKPGLSEIAGIDPDKFGKELMQHFKVRDINHNNIALYKK